jgi:hypothetical protein
VKQPIQSAQRVTVEAQEAGARAFSNRRCAVVAGRESRSTPPALKSLC